MLSVFYNVIVAQSRQCLHVLYLYLCLAVRTRLALRLSLPSRVAGFWLSIFRVKFDVATGRVDQLDGECGLNWRSGPIYAAVGYTSHRRAHTRRRRNPDALLPLGERGESGNGHPVDSLMMRHGTVVAA